MFSRGQRDARRHEPIRGNCGPGDRRAALVEAGRLTPVVDRTYPPADTGAGVRHVEQGHVRGKAVITVP
ncbi:zinc-binding dehydrogenase [Streptomyces sp. NPDC005917]|uniref:zinc-binding dehydrogenase n=1 Tax=unclassified Streptomyces TaxID=2593676 RepID=UPI0033F893B3